jgi:hypothetical protein
METTISRVWRIVPEAFRREGKVNWGIGGSKLNGKKNAEFDGLTGALCCCCGEIYWSELSAAAVVLLPPPLLQLANGFFFFQQQQQFHSFLFLYLFSWTNKGEIWGLAGCLFGESSLGWAKAFPWLLPPLHTLMNSSAAAAAVFRTLFWPFSLCLVFGAATAFPPPPSPSFFGSISASPLWVVCGFFPLGGLDGLHLGVSLFRFLNASSSFSCFFFFPILPPSLLAVLQQGSNSGMYEWERGEEGRDNIGLLDSR